MTDWLTRPQPLERSRWSFAHGWQSSPDDIIAIGGDLEPSTVIAAYRQGIFPMIVETPAPLLAWWSPDPRGILPLDTLRVTRSLRQSARRYDVRLADLKRWNPGVDVLQIGQKIYLEEAR